MPKTYEDGLREAYEAACQLLNPARKTIPQTAPFYAGVDWAASELIAVIGKRIRAAAPAAIAPVRAIPSADDMIRKEPALAARRKTVLVRCPKCGKDCLETEMEGDICRWCTLSVWVSAWVDWREKRQQ